MVQQRHVNGSPIFLRRANISPANFSEAQRRRMSLRVGMVATRFLWCSYFASYAVMHSEEKSWGIDFVDLYLSCIYIYIRCREQKSRFSNSTNKTNDSRHFAAELEDPRNPSHFETALWLNCSDEILWGGTRRRRRDGLMWKEIFKTGM